VYNGKYSSEKKCQGTENGLKLEVQRENVREDIYNVQGRLRNVTKRINQNSAISDHDKELIWKFCEHCKLQGLSTLRVLLYLNRFLDIAKLAKKDFDQMTRDDIQQLVLGVRELRKRSGEPVSERTVQDHLTAIKTFWKWMKGVDNEFPSEVKWIRTSLHGTNSQLPEDLPTPEDIEKLIAAATNTRDKALVSVLYDSGCRIGELLTLRIKNLAFDNYGGVLLVAGKTGQRRVRIIHSVQRLRTWLDEHPLREQPEAMVFCSLSNRQRGGGLNYEAISHMFRKLRKRPGVTKRLNPHSFRHARATLLAQHLTDAQLKQHFGWTADSRMASVYIHLSGKDLDPTLARLAGLTTEQPTNGLEKMKICENCKTVNTPDALRCVQCFRPFLTAELEEKKKIARIVFDTLRQFGVEINEEQSTLL
jgi:integrase/recombinase XerD